MNPPNPLGFLLIPPKDNSPAQSLSAQSIEVVDCPICFDLLLPPVYQCHAGHLLCENCESRLPICPQCRVQLPGSPKIRNLYAEQAIGAKVFKCNSCFASVQGDDVKDHREDCALRAHNYCRHLSIKCNHQCTRAQLVDHLTSVHWITGQELSESVFSGTRICVKLEQVASAIDLRGFTVEEAPIHFSPHFVQCMSKLFIVSTNVQTTPFGMYSLSWTIFGIGGEKVCKDILVKIRLTPNYSSLNYLEWQGPIYPIKSNRQGNVFTVSGGTLEELVTSNQQDYQTSDNPFLKWNIDIAFTKKSELLASAAAAGSSLGIFSQNLPTLKTGFISADRFLFGDEVFLEPAV